MTTTKIVLLLIFASSIGLGQILFKLAADRIQWNSGAAMLIISALNPYLISAMIVYVAATGLWLYLLKSTPLSSAYPFVAISFLFVPVAAAVLLGEKIGLSYGIGLGMVVAGLFFVVR
jgi:drug/metabolite transporter (DMT)-like permease